MQSLKEKVLKELRDKSMHIKDQAMRKTKGVHLATDRSVRSISIKEEILKRKKKSVDYIDSDEKQKDPEYRQLERELAREG